MSLSLAERWLQIIDLLAGSRKGLTAAEIADRIDRSATVESRDLRTLQRDIQALHRSGIIPLCDDGEKPRRWRLDQERLAIFASRFTLSHDIAAVVTLMDAVLRGYLPPEVEQRISDCLDDARRFLEFHDSQDLPSWHSKVEVRFSGREPHAVAEGWHARERLLEATYRKLKIRLELEGSDPLVVSPNGLVFRGGSTHVLIGEGEAATNTLSFPDPALRHLKSWRNDQPSRFAVTSITLIDEAGVDAGETLQDWVASTFEFEAELADTTTSMEVNAGLAISLSTLFNSPNVVESRLDENRWKVEILMAPVNAEKLASIEFSRLLSGSYGGPFAIDAPRTRQTMKDRLQRYRHRRQLTA